MNSACMSGWAEPRAHQCAAALSPRSRRASARQAGAHVQEDKYREKGFDLRRYERLQRDIRRYERYLSRASDQHVSVYPEEEEEQLPMQAAGARLAS